jgi:hypothetical protein
VWRFHKKKLKLELPYDPATTPGHIAEGT